MRRVQPKQSQSPRWRRRVVLQAAGRRVCWLLAVDTSPSYEIIGVAPARVLGVNMIVTSGTIASSPTVVGKAASLAGQSYSSAAFQVQLSILDHHGVETSSMVTHLPAILGRSAKSDVRLADPWVSGFHCVLNEIDGTLVVRDLGSKNGVFLKGRRVNDAHVLPGDRLTIGQTRVTLQYQRPGRTTAEAPTCETVAKADPPLANQEPSSVSDTEKRFQDVLA